MEFRTGVDLALEKLIEHRSADNPEVTWTDFKETVTSVATETVGLKQSTLPSKPWITSEMIDTVNEKRRSKDVQVNNQLCWATDNAREIWRKEQCDEIEKLHKQGRTDLTHQKVKKLPKRKQRRPRNAINDRDGNILIGNRQIQSRWNESYHHHHHHIFV